VATWRWAHSARRFSGLWTRRILGVVLLIAIVNFWVGYLGKQADSHDTAGILC